MSIPQPDHAYTIVVEPWLAAVLHRQTLLVLKFNHHHFKGFRDLDPEDQLARANVFREAFAVMDALGWSPEELEEGPVEVPLTAGHIEQLYRRRYELASANFDRLAAFDAAQSDEEAAAIRSEIEADRLAVQALDRLFTAFEAATEA